jgi:hypothetical protein
MGKKLDLGVLDWIMLILLIVGGLNWGLVGLLDFDLVVALFSEGTFLTNTVYTLVGVSALYYLIRALMGGNEEM